MLKTKIQVWSNSSNAILRELAHALKALGAARRFVWNSSIRSEQITRALHPHSHYQGATATGSNRYPELFKACRRHLQSTPSPRILSFGCATGEEVFSLADYMPKAIIVGVDINRWCLRQCNKNNTSAKIRFLHSLSYEFANLSDFDAIFCMAVFQRTENRTQPTNVAHGNFTFDKFEKEIRALDSKLKIGGLFFIDHADFSFEHTMVAARYAPLEFPGNQIQQDRPLFGRDNKLVSTQYHPYRAFHKQN